MSSPRTSCDQPTTKIASGRSARTASIVSDAFTSAVSTSGAPTSSKAHWPERFGSIGPGSVTTPAISAPASRAASRVSRPIVSKLTQTARTGADSTTRPFDPYPRPVGQVDTAALLHRFRPVVQYDSRESFYADSTAI